MLDRLQKTKNLVCDNNQGFLRYFKKVFPDCIFVEFSGNQGNQFILGEYDLVFFMADSQINLSEFFKLLNTKIPILSGSASLKNNPSEIKKMKAWLDIKFLDKKSQSYSESDIENRATNTADFYQRE